MSDLDYDVPPMERARASARHMDRCTFVDGECIVCGQLEETDEPEVD